MNGMYSPLQHGSGFEELLERSIVPVTALESLKKENGWSTSFCAKGDDGGG